MKKWFVFLCVLLLCIFYIGSYFQKEQEAPAYILSVYEGQIAVFIRGEDEPLTLLETRIASLPQTEAERLRTGITAENAEALQRLIEDYCS